MTIHEAEAQLHITPVKPMQERMMFLSKHITRLRASKQDKQARSQLAQMTGTAETAWTVSKKMFTKSRLFSEANTAITLWSSTVDMYSTMCGEKGMRLIPSAEFMPLTNLLRPLRGDAEVKDAAFRANYEQEVANDMVITGLSRADYPDVPPAVQMTLDPRPIAPSDAFYQDVDESTRRQYEDMLDAAEQAGKDDVVRRMLAPLEQTVKRLGEYTGEKRQRWHQDVVDNAYDTLDILEGLVTDGDDTIMALIGDVRATLSPYYDNEKLKTSQLARDTAKQQMEDILSRFE